MEKKKVCPHCGKPIYDEDALRCWYCGRKLYSKLGFLGNIKYSKYGIIIFILVLFALIIFIIFRTL